MLLEGIHFLRILLSVTDALLEMLRMASRFEVERGRTQGRQSLRGKLSIWP